MAVVVDTAEAGFDLGWIGGVAQLRYRVSIIKQSLKSVAAYPGQPG